MSEMVIASFLDRRDVAADVPAGTKQEVLSSLVNLLARNHPELDRELLLTVMLKREELRSTGIEHGVAFPHGRVSGLNHLRACLGRCRTGTDFDSFDGRPTCFFFVLLIPEQSEGSHLKALARLNRVFQDEDFRHRLMRAKDASELFATIIDQDQRC